MGDLPTQLIVSLPVAAALIVVIKLFLNAQKEWRDDLKVTSSASNDVIERNTQALLKIEGTLSACSKNQGKAA